MTVIHEILALDSLQTLKVNATVIAGLLVLLTFDPISGQYEKYSPLYLHTRSVEVDNDIGKLANSIDQIETAKQDPDLSIQVYDELEKQRYNKGLALVELEYERDEIIDQIEIMNSDPDSFIMTLLNMKITNYVMIIPFAISAILEVIHSIKKQKIIVKKSEITNENEIGNKSDKTEKRPELPPSSLGWAFLIIGFATIIAGTIFLVLATNYVNIIILE